MEDMDLMKHLRDYGRKVIENGKLLDEEGLYMELSILAKGGNRSAQEMKKQLLPAYLKILEQKANEFPN